MNWFIANRVSVERGKWVGEIESQVLSIARSVQQLPCLPITM